MTKTFYCVVSCKGFGWWNVAVQANDPAAARATLRLQYPANVLTIHSTEA